jgi:hypothetical protein
MDCIWKELVAKVSLQYAGEHVRGKKERLEVDEINRKKHPS